MPPEGKVATVKDFRTFLPSFQGEALLSKLEEKHVVITVAPEEERSLFWQFVLGILPWALIIGLWIFPDEAHTAADAGWPGRCFQLRCKQGKTL